MIWAAYLRVSTDEQARKGVGLDVQRESITRWLPKGDSIHDFYVDDGYSGAREDRPALQKLLRNAREGKFKGVVVYKTDRLARSIKIIVKLALDVFEELDLSFVSVTEPYDTRTPQGRLFFSQLAGFADFERELIRERTLSGRMRRAKEGMWLTWNPPFGYNKNEKGHLVINRDEAEVYEMMVRWAMEDRIGSHTIARRLNGMGIPTRYVRYAKSAKIPFTETKKDKFFWVYRTVHRVLTNPIYKGDYKIGDTIVQLPRLISPERWAALRQQLRDNWKNKPLRTTKQRHLLQSLLFCGRCGRRVFGKVKPRWRCPRYDCRHALNEEIVDGKLPSHCTKCGRALTKPWFHESRVYRCWGKETREVPWAKGKCNLPSVQMDKANQVVWGKVRELATNHKKLQEVLESELSKSSVDEVILQVERDRIERAVKEKDQRIDALLSSNDLIGRPDYVKRNVDRLHAEKLALESDFSKLTDQLAQVERVKQGRKRLEKNWLKIGKRLDSFSEQERFDFLHAFVSRVVVNYAEKTGDHVLDLEVVLEPAEEEQLPKSLREALATR